MYLRLRAQELRVESSDAETMLWLKLRGRRLAGYKFRRQHPIGPYIVDFVCIEAQLVVELDGGQHAEPEHAQRDLIRTRFLETHGYRVARFWNHEMLQHTDAVLEVIRMHLFVEGGEAPLDGNPSE